MTTLWQPCVGEALVADAAELPSFFTVLPVILAGAIMIVSLLSWVPPESQGLSEV
jgi:hypothetical protein